MKVCAALLAFFCVFSVLGQQIVGTLTDENNAPLPFASIYVKAKNIGTSSNVEGKYVLQLPQGTHTVVYQFIGYATITKTVVVGPSAQTLDVQLLPEIVALQNVSVSSASEDPAYTIMRKAISLARYHLLQTNSYSARVYTKGSGRVEKIPWGFRSLAAKEGVTEGRVFTSESVIDIAFERPNTFTQKVISMRVSGPNDKNASPNSYINSSFYMPLVAESVSPLAPNALSYYKFKYMGSFMDRGFEINKILVVPRSKGYNLYEGTIYIREIEYDIHSLDLTTSVENADIRINQIYAPVVADVWLPITTKLHIDVAIMGAAFGYNYLASTSNYQVVLNPDMQKNYAVIDEKVTPVPVVKKKKASAENDSEITRKQLNKMLDDYERAQEKANDSSDVLYDNTFLVDSNARKKDDAFWDSIRTVPLTDAEIKGYEKTDSTYIVNEAERQKDSTKAAPKSRFGADDFIMGAYYSLGKKNKLLLDGLLTNIRYNTVEGFNFNLGARLYLGTDTNHAFSIKPLARYGFSSHQFYGLLDADYRWGAPGHSKKITLVGGSYIYQYQEDGINNLVNSLYTLFLRRNYMRLYSQDFVALKFTQNINYKYMLTAGASWAQRYDLANNTNYSFFYQESKDYLPNLPINIQGNTANTSAQKAFTTSLNFVATPWLKFGKRNGKLIPLTDGVTTFRLSYNAGWAGISGSSTEFQHIEFGLKKTQKIGVRLTIDVDAEAGTFLQAKNLGFMDFKHFHGGLTELAPVTLTGNYRLLDYYYYSTSKSYVSAFTYFRFRKLALTQLAPIRMLGIKENLFANYLKTTDAPHYVEVGYTIDNLFNILRIEFAYNFNTSPIAPAFGWRLGLATRVQF